MNQVGIGPNEFLHEIRRVAKRRRAFDREHTRL
jgi:hypothetical protein